MNTKNKTLCLALILMLSGCERPIFEEDARPVPKYRNSEFVRSVVSDQMGQVITEYCWPGESACFYDVRFVGLSMTTDTNVLSSDGPISVAPLSIVEHMREYELEGITK